MTAGSPKIFSGSPLITDAPKCSEKVLEESITLCGPKDSGEVVWSSGSRCRGMESVTVEGDQVLRGAEPYELYIDARQG